MVNIIRDVFDLNNDIDEKDLFKIVNELNGHIKYDNESIYPVNIKKDKNSFIVVINNKLIRNNLTYNLAFELSHLFLHLKIFNKVY